MNARVLVLWFGLGLVFMLAAAPAQGELQVGIGRRVITPDPLLPISGGLGPTAPARPPSPQIAPIGAPALPPTRPRPPGWARRR
jgi:hypothetical protein